MNKNELINQRLTAARREMERQHLDAYLLISRANKFYLSGFDHYSADDQSTSFLYITGSDSYFGVDKMEKTAAKEAACCCEIVLAENPGEDIGTLIKHIAGSARIPGMIGYEEYALKYRDFLRLKEQLPSSELVVSEISEQLRMKKSPDEISRVESAMELAGRALDDVLPGIREGRTEKEIAWELEKRARELGADDLSFPVIVASGENTAKPHHFASDRKIQSGDFVLIDFGVMLGGYCSDMTRTYIIGEASDRQKQIYAAVLEAFSQAVRRARPGMTTTELDSVARGVLKSYGLDEAFTHSLGHGVGLEVHEPPWLSQREEMPLEDGMLFSIEPGAYIEGFGGVRIEDTFVLEKAGARTLAHSAHELIEL